MSTTSRIARCMTTNGPVCHQPSKFAASWCCMQIRVELLSTRKRDKSFQLCWRPGQKEPFFRRSSPPGLPRLPSMHVVEVANASSSMSHFLGAAWPTKTVNIAAPALVLQHHRAYRGNLIGRQAVCRRLIDARQTSGHSVQKAPSSLHRGSTYSVRTHIPTHAPACVAVQAPARTRGGRKHDLLPALASRNVATWRLRIKSP